MIKGKISNGFEFEIDEQTLDDMEFVDALAETEDNPLKISQVSKMLLGESQKKRLYDYLRNENGRVPVQGTIDAITEIMDTAGEDIKNS